MSVAYRVYPLSTMGFEPTSTRATGLDFRSEIEVCQSPIPLEEFGGDAYAPPWTYPTSEAVTVGD
jgi:hypothetical protein